MARAKKREERRKKRLQREASRVAKRGADASPDGAAESKGDAAAPGEVTVSLVEKPPPARRASQFTGMELMAANVEAARNAAFVSLDSELTENDNPAVALSFTAFLVAICIVITGPRTPGSIDDEADVVSHGRPLPRATTPR